MRGIKPFKLGFLSRPFEYRRQFHLGIAALGWVPLDGSKKLLPEVSMWESVAEDLGDPMLDVGIPKSRGEALLTGSAFAPGGQAATTCPVKLRIGPIDKTLYVIGDRHWEGSGPTQPVPFESLPLTWERAFGGAGFKRNPLGRGMPGSEPVMLPNVELPGHMVDSQGKRPPPAGFGPVDMMWPQRQQWAGTYDQDWIDNHYPGFANDIDWRLFNLAPEDQLLEGFFNGDEAFELTNVHPTLPKIRGALPGIGARAFLHFRETPETDLREVPMNLTTVWFFPHRLRALLIWHGAGHVAEDDAWDVEDIMVAAEDLGAKKPLEHYQRVFALRRKRDVEGSLAVLKDSDLLPPGCDDSLVEDEGRLKGLIEPKGLLKDNLRRRMEEENAKARAEVASRGLDPSQFGPPPLEPEPEVTLENFQALVDREQAKADQLQKEGTERIEAMKAEMREQCRAAGIDFDQIVPPIPERAPAPLFSAEGRLAEMAKTARDAREAGAPLPELEACVADPRFRQQLVEAEAQAREAYRLSAHFQEGRLRRLAGEDAARVRAEVEGALVARESLAGKDLSGADLSDLDLSGADLRAALLENVSFSGCSLRGANLTAAVAAFADFTRADLDGAILVNTNLGRATFHRATAPTGIDATGAIIDRADFRGAALRGLRLGEGVALEASFDGASLPGLEADRRNFIRCSMRGTELPGGRFTYATFLEMDLSDLDLSGAHLERTTFYKVRAERLNLSGAYALNARFVVECLLARLRAPRAHLDGASMRGLDLREADLEAASLAHADLSESDLTGANLRGAHARQALLIRTNLTRASLQGADLMDAMLTKANLSSTDLGGASLFQTDFARVISDGQANVQGANTTNSRVKPLRSP